jgi:hypothetical protein
MGVKDRVISEITLKTYLPLLTENHGLGSIPHPFFTISGFRPHHTPQDKRFFWLRVRIRGMSPPSPYHFPETLKYIRNNFL